MTGLQRNLKAAFALIRNQRTIVDRHCTRKMAHTKRPDHMEITSENTRQPTLSDAVVTQIENISPTVKSLVLTVQNKELSFKAGQWVDFFIQGVDIFTGYSMVSRPSLLTKENILELAVKVSDYPPTEWVHKKCKVGSEVKVRIGGDFFYDPKPGEVMHNVLLIAGGVGINPILSIMEHIAYLKDLAQNNLNIDSPQKVKILYSAKNLAELLFKERIESICASHKDMSCSFFITNEEPISENYAGERINEKSLRSAMTELSMGKNDDPLCYMCGPAPMLDTMETHLLALGTPQTHIKYEKWW